ncbi:MAG TPA: tyrosine-type recombinase/integrase [Pyrinomonadaceae bacterium]|nr:tyrosine-type recombinase/integrase [Pyrinomonadaceae bacterium]
MSRLPQSISKRLLIDGLPLIAHSVNRKISARRGLRFISVATRWLRFLGHLDVPAPPPEPYAHLVKEFADYMEREKGLASNTIRIECFYVEKFLNFVWARHYTLDQLTVRDLDQALAQNGSQQTQPRVTIRTKLSALRAFFRYAEMRGWCTQGLAEAISLPRIFKSETLPLGPSWQDVQRLLASTEGNRPTDIRDRAIVMLLAVYGLRSTELRCLKLEDLDWERELICVTRFKARRKQLYPLSHTVGEPILRYLREVRPRASYREIFLSMKAPLQPLSKAGLWNIVSRRLRSLDVTIKHRGPHSLRHACATHLLSQGLSLKEIGDHLGHRNPDATRLYAKVDLKGLREVADFHIGGLL